MWSDLHPSHDRQTHSAETNEEVKTIPLYKTVKNVNIVLSVHRILSKECSGTSFRQTLVIQQFVFYFIFIQF